MRLASPLTENVRTIDGIFVTKYWLHYEKFVSNSVDLMKNLQLRKGGQAVNFLS